MSETRHLLDDLQASPPDVRIGLSAPFVWAAAAALWVWMIRTTPGRLVGKWRETFGQFPVLAYLGMVLVISVTMAFYFALERRASRWRRRVS